MTRPGDRFDVDLDEWRLEQAADRVDRERDVDELHGEYRTGAMEHAEFVAEIGRERAAAERVAS